MRHKIIRALGAVLLCSLAACSHQTKSEQSSPPFQPTATIQDLMAAEIDPAADFIWDAVSSTHSAGGDEEKQPRSNEEWLAVRHQAITLIEASNLLLMEGRLVAVKGRALEDADIPGISTPEHIQTAIDADRQSFVKFVQAFNAAGVKILSAIDAKNAESLLEAGDALDKACENCHLKYWYPSSPRP